MKIRVLASEQKQYLVGVLELACEKLDITNSERQSAQERYASVGEWLSSGDEDFLKDVSVYAQGSVRLRTVIRPIKSNEFDVDLVCYLPRAQHLDPSVVRDMVGNRLRAHEKYERMLSPLNRGWRLQYHNEFHLDITPAVADSADQNGGLLVPDRYLSYWKESNPKGYATWFDEVAAKEPGLLLERVVKADVEAMPSDIPFKGSLRRIVQIMKRHRDLWCSKLSSEEERDDAPISIVITTLTAYAFLRLISNHYDDAIDLMADVVDSMCAGITHIDGEDGSIEAWVTNPLNEKENFADKWKIHPAREEAFYEWHRAFKRDLDGLAESGLDGLAHGLTNLIDEPLAKGVLVEVASRINASREYGSTLVSSAGRIAVASGARVAAVPKNTFYGE